MIVEDSEDVREALTEILANEGYAVHATANGREALDFLHAKPRPERALILLDLMMPEMNGWEFMEAKHEEAKTDARMAEHQVVTMSAVATPLPPENSVPKPISFDRLMNTVRSYCGSATAAS